LIPEDIGWFWIIIVLAAAAPFGGSILAAILEVGQRKKDMKFEFMAPYQDGQLGYVVVGWVAAALLEMSQYVDKWDFALAHHIKTQAEHDAAMIAMHSWSGGATAGCWLIGALSALCAAMGASNPVPESNDDNLPFYRFYFSGLLSIGLVMVGFYVVNVVHNHVISGGVS
jgi:hypothetical protein